MAGVKSAGTKASRRAQAKQTRDRILDVAYQLFCADGYDATTMQRIADAAGVAVQTVYFTFRTKSALVAEVEERAVLGDGPPSSWRDQSWAAELAAETDPRRLLERFVEIDTEIKGRLSPLVAALGPALRSDPDTVAERERGQDAFFGSVIDRLVALNGLRPDVSRDRAKDIVRVINTVSSFADLTTRRGWTSEDWRDWLTDLLATQLLTDE